MNTFSCCFKIPLRCLLSLAATSLGLISKLNIHKDNIPVSCVILLYARDLIFLDYMKYGTETILQVLFLGM